MIPPYLKDNKPAKIVSFIVHDNEYQSLISTKAVTAVALTQTGDVE